MGLFGTKKTNNPLPSETSIAPDILSQVRVMGEKAPAGESAAPHNLPTTPVSTNPVSNPFIQDQDDSVVTPATTEATSVAPMNPISQFTPPQPVATPGVEPALKIMNNPVAGVGEEHHSSKILIIGSILAVGLILIVGIFLYLETIHDKEIVANEPEVAATTENQPAPETAPKPALETETFSTTRSNYLAIDPETATKEVILAEIAKKEAQMTEGKVADPIVFQVTDQNNIPLAISRFAYLMEFAPGEDLLAALDEDFTLVLYMENGKIHRGIATKFKEDQEKPGELLTRYEGLLPSIFHNLLYPAEVTLPAASTFSSGSYNNSVVRYSNIAPDQGYSFDYILQDKLFFFGNGKDVTRKTLEVGVR